MRGIRDRHNDVGGVQYQMREKVFSVGDDFWIEAAGGELAFKVDGKALRLRGRFTIDLESGGELEATGNIVDHEYASERDGHKVAEVSKRWFRMRDTYGIEVAADEDQALILAAAVCIDRMSHD